MRSETGSRPSKKDIETNKNKQMKKIMLAGLLLLSTIMATKAQTGEKNFIDRPYIEVTGKAEMEVTPDRIYMILAINEKDSKGKTVLAESEREMISKLKELGIDTKKDLSVRDMSSNFKKYWIKSSEIMTNKEYQLIVSSAQNAGRVMQGLEKIGISNVTIERVEHSQIEALRKDVKIMAAKNAREKATDLANAVGQGVGNAIFIQEIDYEQPYMQGRLAEVAFKSAADRTEMDMNVPDIEFEKIKLEYRVHAKFELRLKGIL